MSHHDLTLGSQDLAALRQLVGRRLLSTQTVHPWFATVWEGSLRTDLTTEDGVVSFEGIFSPDVIDGLADQLLGLRVRAGAEVPPWTLHGFKGRNRSGDFTANRPKGSPLIKQLRIIREDVRVAVDDASTLELTMDLGVLVTLVQDADEAADSTWWDNRDREGNFFLGIIYDQHEPVMGFGRPSSTMFRFGIHTYPGAVNWFLEPGQRLVHSRHLVDLDDAEVLSA